MAKVDPLIELSDTVNAEFGESLRPGAWLVDSVPILRFLPSWFPGAGFQKIAMKYRRHGREMVEKPFAFVQQQMAKGTAENSYVANLLEELRQAKEIGDLSDSAAAEEEASIKWSASVLYGAGAETSISSINSFFLWMILHPDIFLRAQAEVDAVVGPDRLPSLSDRPKLPCIEAILKEVLRLYPVVPLGVPHRSVQDDVFNGFFIPKGSILISNIWQYTHDPKYYHDPTAFKPERFLPGGPGKGGEPELDPRELIFGFGRRICVGKELADNSLFLMIAISLATMNISKAIDPKTGQEIEPVVDYPTRFVIRPKPFAYSVRPRSKQAEQLIASVEDEHPSDINDAKEMKNVKWERSDGE